MTSVFGGMAQLVARLHGMQKVTGSNPVTSTEKLGQRPGFFVFGAGSDWLRIIWYTAMSMDGRIADACDSLGFLDAIGAWQGSESEFATFLTGIDAIIIGAATLRWLLRAGHGWPHGDIPTWLVSHDAMLATQVGQTAASFTRMEGDLNVAIDAIKTAGHECVWLCGGGNVAGQLLALDCIDEVIVTVAPVALGQGPALFDAPALTERRFGLIACHALNDRTARLHWVRTKS